MRRVKCLYCNQYFDADTIPFIKPRANRYAHRECPGQLDAEQQAEKKDIIEKDAFWAYIKKLYGAGYNFVKLNAFAEKYIKEYNFTWTGMLKALRWYYEIQGNPKDSIDYETIGILPYIYEDAKKYYYNIHLAQEKNKHVLINQQSPQVIIIQPPKKRIFKHRLFDLDKEI